MQSACVRPGYSSVFVTDKGQVVIPSFVRWGVVRKDNKFYGCVRGLLNYRECMFLVDDDKPLFVAYKTGVWESLKCPIGLYRFE